MTTNDDRRLRSRRSRSGSKVLPAQRRLAKLNKATETIRAAIADFRQVDDLDTFLERMLEEALRAVGVTHGAMVLIEGEPGRQTAHLIVAADRGLPLSSEMKRSRGMERAPLDDELSKFAERVAGHPDGIRSFPDSAWHPQSHRDHLHAQQLKTIHSIALQIGERMIGWFSVGYFDEHSPSPDQIGVQRRMAQEMAVTMEVARPAERSRLADRAEAERHRLDRLTHANRALVGAANLLAGALDIDAMLAYILRTISAQFTASRGCALWMIDAERQLQYRYMGCLDGIVKTGTDLNDPGSQPRPIYPQLFRSTSEPIQPFFLRSADLPEDRRQFLASFGAGDAVVFPMYLRDEPIGAFTLALLIGAADPATDELQIAQTLATQAMLALQLQRQAKESQQAAVALEQERAAQQRADELAKANRALTTSLDAIAEGRDFDQTLGRLLRVVADQIGCDSATLCLKDSDGDEFRVELIYREGQSRAPADNADSERSCPKNDHPLWRALIDERKAVSITQSDFANDKLAAPRWFETADVQTLLAVPLIQRHHVIGCFTFAFAGTCEFAAEQIELLQTLAHQATLAVQLERSARVAQDESRQAATLAERSRIARDLHDGLAQGLTGILMRLQASLRCNDSGQMRQHVSAALDTARDALVDARRSVHALRSISAERLDFSRALKGVLRTAFAGSTVAAEVHSSGEGKQVLISNAIEAELLRIAQEAATNTLKHAHASRFDARIEWHASRLRLELEDDGDGFNPALVTEGFGLTGIRERVQRLGAAIEVRSAPAKGTRIAITVPLTVAEEGVDAPQ